MNFCILPAGAWGTALAIHLAREGHTVTLVTHLMEEALEIATSRENRKFLPGYALEDSIQIGFELKPVLMEAEVIILASPVKFLRSICRRVVQNREAAWKLQVVLILTKGLEPESNEFPIRIVEEEIPDLARGILSGPTFASQVADGVPSAIVLATSAEAQLARRVQQAISGPTVRVYTTDDLIGVELGGCLKNIYAIGAGICDGLGLGDNARAALLTRSLAEMVRLGTALGGRVETFYGLSGVGDLVLTCNGKESRNRTFGEEFARGASIQTLLDERRMTVEGYQTADCFHHLCRRKGLEVPILNEIHAMLFGGKKPLDAVESLMTQELRQESE